MMKEDVASSVGGHEPQCDGDTCNGQRRWTLSRRVKLVSPGRQEKSILHQE